MKYTQRLDYGRLAEVLHERGLAGLDAIRELLQLSQDGGMPFCEALVTSNLVSDWDLSKVVCETFQLPFLPVDLIEPNPAALLEVDQKFFHKHQLVPVDIFGQVLTVAMPALVPAEVLSQVAAQSDCVVIPLVGTVESNRRWIAEKMAPAPVPEVEGGWESMFDAADAQVAATGDGGAVAEGLGVFEDPLFAGPDEDQDAAQQQDSLGDASLEILQDDDDLDLDLGILDDIGLDEPNAAAPPAGPTGALPDLPPMPEFNPGDKREAS